MPFGAQQNPQTGRNLHATLRMLPVSIASLDTNLESDMPDAQPDVSPLESLPQHQQIKPALP